MLLVAILVTWGLLRLANNYLYDGFARSYADGGTWKYLAARFSIETKPTDIRAEDTWSGPSQLDRKDVVFETEAGISSAGIYIKINALGRIFLPWNSVSLLKRHRIANEIGWQQMVSIVLDGPEIDLNIPWHSGFDELVPQSVGVG
jgi:hypothetical protein